MRPQLRRHRPGRRLRHGWGVGEHNIVGKHHPYVEQSGIRSLWQAPESARASLTPAGHQPDVAATIAALARRTVARLSSTVSTCSLGGAGGDPAARVPISVRDPRGNRSTGVQPGAGPVRAPSWWRGALDRRRDPDELRSLARAHAPPGAGRDAPPGTTPCTLRRRHLYEGYTRLAGPACALRPSPAPLLPRGHMARCWVHWWMATRRRPRSARWSSSSAAPASSRWCSRCGWTTSDAARRSTARRARATRPPTRCCASPSRRRSDAVGERSPEELRTRPPGGGLGLRAKPQRTRDSLEALLRRVACRTAGRPAHRRLQRRHVATCSRSAART